MDKTLESEEREGTAKVIASGSATHPGRTRVDIRALKRSVTSSFGSSSLLRKVVLAEPDYLPAEELVGKIGTWLAILREETP